MSSQRYNRIERAIDRYESMVNKGIARLKRAFFADLSFVVIIPIVAVILAGFFSNIAGILTTLGVGAVNAEERLRRGHTILIKYWSDRSALEDTVNILRLELQLCDPSDSNGLDRVEQLVRGYAKSLK